MNTGTQEAPEQNDQISKRVEELGQDPHTAVAQTCLRHGAGESEDIDAQHLAETPAAEVNDNQHIDVARIKLFFENQISLERVPLSELTAVKEMVFELCDLAQEAGFLKDVQEARQELAGEDERYKVLPNLY